MPRRAITTERVERGLGAGRSPGSWAGTAATRRTNKTATQAMVLALTMVSPRQLDDPVDPPRVAVEGAKRKMPGMAGEFDEQS
jgi:hypothetical protein